MDLGLGAVLGRIADIQQRFGAPAAFTAPVAPTQEPLGSIVPVVAGGAGGLLAAPPTTPSPAFTPGAALAPPAAPGGSTAPGGPGGAGAPGAPGATPPAASAWHARVPAAGRPWLGDIERAASAAGIDPRLLTAVVQVESGFRPQARSHAGAIGLGQLMPGTARALGVDPHDPQQNLAGAARYLREQLDRFGSVELALAAYNAGPNRVARAGGVPQIAETQAYVRRVGGVYTTLRS